MAYSFPFMKRRLFHIAFLLCVARLSVCAQEVGAQLNPYVDDKLFHYGFFLGVDMPGYIVDSVAMPQYHVRSSAIGIGFNFGFVADLRLSRHLNLRFTPGLHFSKATLNYKPKDSNGSAAKADNLSIPFTLPLFLKWSAEREGNYRPFVSIGGGFSLDCNSFGDRENRKILTKPCDGYVGVGFGCDFYLPWFKLCPELRYEIGFANVLTPIGDTKGTWMPTDTNYKFYTENIDRLTNQRISLIINFE